MIKCRMPIGLMACGYKPAFGECGVAWDDRAEALRVAMRQARINRKVCWLEPDCARCTRNKVVPAG